MSTRMTRPPRSRARQDYGAIKHALLAGSVLASLAGARVLAWQAPVAPTPASPSDPARPVQITIEPLDLPLEMAGAAGEPLLLDLPPVPTAVSAQPRPVQPVARTRSSR